MSTVQTTQPNWMDDLISEHGRCVTYEDAESKNYIRLFQDGFRLVRDTNDQWWPPPAWEGADSGEAKHWAQRYLEIKARMAKQQFEKARTALVMRLNRHVDRQEPLPTEAEMNELKDELRALKQRADDAFQEYDSQVLEPARQIKAKHEEFERQQQAAMLQRHSAIRPILAEIAKEFGSGDETNGDR